MIGKQTVGVWVLVSLAGLFASKGVVGGRSFVKVLVLLMLAGFVGCSLSDQERIVIVDGSSTVFPISVSAQEVYHEVNPRSRIIVDNHGTGGGFSRYNQGEVDIVDASRLAKPEEEAEAKAQGYDWTRFLVAHDGITVVVHPRNDWAEALTVEQLKRAFEPDSTVRTWSDLDSSWPNRAIKFYSPDNDSGTFDFFTEVIVGVEGAQRRDIQASSDDNTLVTGVAGDIDALGYFGFAYYIENQNKLKAVKIQADANAEPVEPTLESVYAKQYQPLSRPLYIYVKNEVMEYPEAANFVSFYLNNLETLARVAGYVEPTEQERAENLAMLQILKDRIKAEVVAIADEL